MKIDWIAIIWNVLGIAALIGCLLLVFGRPASAQTNVEFLFGSHHTSSSNYNESNPGLIFRLDNGLTFGVYDNSEYNTSVFAGYGKTFGNGDFKLRLTGGLVTGYEHAEIIPGCFLTFNIKDFVNIYLIPDPVNEQVVLGFGVKLFDW